MRIRLHWSLAAVLGLLACESEPTNPANTTTSSEETGDGDGGAEHQGCVPPQSEAFTCASDDDCAIAGDCCSCFAYTPEFVDPVECGGSCAMDKCEEWGITQAQCVDGHCAAVGLSCNQAVVTCKVAPPVCDADSLPQVVGDCYTGACLPVEACDWVPDCSTCAQGQLCMHELRGGCDYVRCVDDIDLCQGESPCCVGENWCGTGQCTETADGFACGE